VKNKQQVRKKKRFSMLCPAYDKYVILHTTNTAENRPNPPRQQATLSSPSLALRVSLTAV
ncbi:MAG: hypothetical protein ACKO0V_20590, partial [bacterium]